MESKRSTQVKRDSRRVISLARMEDETSDLDQRLIEAMERIERVRSKAAFAVGSLLSASR